MNSPTLAWSEPCLWALSLNWVIRDASPKPVMQFRTQASWACSGTWDWTKSVHLSDVHAAGDVLRGRDPGAVGQLGRILRNGDRVQVRDEEDGVVLVLHPDPVHEGAEVVAQVQGVGGGLHAGEDAVPGRGGRGGGLAAAVGASGATPASVTVVAVEVSGHSWKP